MISLPIFDGYKGNRGKCGIHERTATDVRHFIGSCGHQLCRGANAQGEVVQEEEEEEEEEQTDLSSMPNPFQKSVSNKTIYSAQRIEKRRNKKKETERCRRKRISEKLTKIHELTLDIIGIGNRKEKTDVRLEKTEMLEFCYHVLSRLCGFVEECPDLQKRLRMSFQWKKINAIASHDDSKPSFDSGFRDIPPDFNEEFTSSSSSFVQHESKSSARQKKRHNIWRPYI
ncbi:hypothetical protein ACTXT7_015131 [Hymenolepis weldensis]